MDVKISTGNIKIDNTWNVNIPPPMMCQGMPCLKRCYSMKAWRLYPNVRDMWTQNYEFYKSDPQGYFDSIIRQIQGAKFTVKFFRWHSAGEIVDHAYFEGIVKVASVCKKTKFLIYTKRYELADYKHPKNLQIIFSVWPGMEVSQELAINKPMSWVDDKITPVISLKDKKPFYCKGHCADCRLCWKLSSLKKDVIFHQH